MDQQAYYPIVFFCCTLIMLCIFVTAYTTMDQIPRMKQVPDDLPPFRVFESFSEGGSAISNRDYRFLLLGFFCLFGMIGTHETLGLKMSN